MDNWVYYEGASTKDFDILASWFYEVYGKMLRLEEANKQLREANEQYRDDYIRLKNGYDEFKLRNRDLAEENKNLKTERSKTEEVLKRYCGDSVDAPISTMVGLIIDDFFYQKAETECQVKELQKAEKTIDKLNKELVEYADKVEKLEKMRWLPYWCQVIDKLDEIIDEEAPERRPSCLYLGRVEEIIDKVSRIKNAIHGRNQVLDQRKATIDRLRKENEKLIHVQGDNAIEHAVEITELKRDISALKTELEECRIMNNEYSRVAKEAVNAGYWAAGTIRNLEEENNKLKDALEFCQKEASSAREHAHNVEVNAERIRKELD